MKPEEDIMKLTQAQYSVQELMELTGFSRTKISKMASMKNWKVLKVKEGRVYKNYYPAKDVQELFPEELKEEKKEIAKEKSKLVQLVEAENKIESLDDVPEKVRKNTLCRYILCRELTKELLTYEHIKNIALENGTYNRKELQKGEIYRKFLEEYKEKYPNEYEILGEVSENTLRRWLNSYDEDDLTTLIPRHLLSQTKGLRKLTSEHRDAIHKLFLTENQPSISSVYRKLQEINFKIPLPTFETVRNYVNKDISPVLKDKFRLGKKAFRDKYENYVPRDYSEKSIKANDLWVSDGHDVEIFCRHPKTGKSTSFKIIVWQDMATRLWVGWSVVLGEDNESIILALRRGIEKYGKPKGVYTDNGKAYRSKDVTSIYNNLDLDVTYAIVRNAQAKPIERTFRDFKEDFAKFSNAYKGGHILEKPERVKDVVKNVENLMEYDEFLDILEIWIEQRNKRVHTGHGMRKRSPLERFNEELPEHEREYIDRSLLNEMLMYREERTVQQGGIQLFNIFYKFDRFGFWIGQKVTVRYDPSNLRELFIYDIVGKLIGIARPVTLASFKESVSQIKESNSIKKKFKKSLKHYESALKEKQEDENKAISVYFEDELKNGRLKYKKVENELESKNNYKESDTYDADFYDDGINKEEINTYDI